MSCFCACVSGSPLHSASSVTPHVAPVRSRFPLAGHTSARLSSNTHEHDAGMGCMCGGFGSLAAAGLFLSSCLLANACACIGWVIADGARRCARFSIPVSCTVSHLHITTAAVSALCRTWTGTARHESSSSAIHATGIYVGAATSRLATHARCGSGCGLSCGVACCR